MARLTVEKLALLAATAALNAVSPRHAELFAATRLAGNHASMYGAVELANEDASGSAPACVAVSTAGRDNEKAI